MRFSERRGSCPIAATSGYRHTPKYARSLATSPPWDWPSWPSKAEASSPRLDDTAFSINVNEAPKSAAWLRILPETGPAFFLLARMTPMTPTPDTQNKLPAHAKETETLQRPMADDGSGAAHGGRSIIVATGMGSGKTECFLWPILDHCRRHAGEEGVKAILCRTPVLSGPGSPASRPEPSRCSAAPSPDRTASGSPCPPSLPPPESSSTNSGPCAASRTGSWRSAT